MMRLSSRAAVSFLSLLRLVLTQLAAVMFAGAVLSVVGALLIVGTVALGLQFTDVRVLVSAGGAVTAVVGLVSLRRRDVV